MNNTEKLDRFLAAIYADGEAERQRLAAIIDQNRGAAMEQAEHDALQASYEFVHAEVERIRTAHGGRVSAEVQAARRVFSAKQQQLTEDLFARVAEKIRGFTGKPAYEAALTRLWKEAQPALGDGPVTLYLRNEDLALGGKLFPHVSLEQGDIQLGGFIAVSENRRVDASYDTALAQAMKKFAEEVHQ